MIRLNSSCMLCLFYSIVFYVHYSVSFQLLMADTACVFFGCRSFISEGKMQINYCIVFEYISIGFLVLQAEKASVWTFLHSSLANLLLTSVTKYSIFTERWSFGLWKTDTRKWL